MRKRTSNFIGAVNDLERLFGTSSTRRLDGASFIHFNAASSSQITASEAFFSSLLLRLLLLFLVASWLYDGLFPSLGTRLVLPAQAAPHGHPSPFVLTYYPYLLIVGVLQKIPIFLLNFIQLLRTL